MGQLIMGKHSYGEPICKGAMNDIYIGAYTTVAEGVIFDSGFKHNVRSISAYPFSRLFSEAAPNIDMRGDIHIGNDVYIGQDAIIMSGVRIGDGAVIGARTIVTRNIAPYEVVAGAPMKHLYWRYDQKQIRKLQKISWWNWEDNNVRENVNLLQSGDINKFISLHYNG